MSQVFWTKGQIFSLSPHFTTQEFTCHCSFPDCINQMIEQELIDRLEKIRTDIGMPITIDSGFRCAEYQKQLGDTHASTVVATHSQHELGAACDARCQMAYDDYLAIAAKYFMSIGLGKTFLHLDLRDDKVRRWNY